MTNAERFEMIFGIYATELWSKSEAEFLEWLNQDVPGANGGDLISRRAVCDWLKWYGNDAVKQGYKTSIIYAWKHIRDEIPSVSDG